MTLERPCRWIVAAIVIALACGHFAHAEEPASGISLSEHRDTFAPGSRGNQVLISVENLSDMATPEFVAAPVLPLQWVEIVSITPRSAQLAPGAVQDFVVTFDVRPGAPSGGSEAVTIFFTMGSHIRSHRHDLIVDFVEKVEAPVTDILPDLEVVEFKESFKAGTTGNAVVFQVENTTAFPVVSLSLRPHLPPQYLTLDRIDPQTLDLDPGQKAEIVAEFSVRKDAEEGDQDVIEFHFEAESGNPIPIPRYRLVATIEAGEEDAPAAQCNSAVESGGDAGGGVTVDLGGFVGRAGFSWEMYSIKDQMNVTVGGVQKTTGCVSGNGTFELDIQQGAATATVEVVPNCEQTTGTNWNFTFECPLKSTVTADGSGGQSAHSDDSGGTAGGTQASGRVPATGRSPAVPSGGSATSASGVPPTASGAPVAPANVAPPPSGPTGNSLTENESNDTVASATPLDPGDMVSGAIAQMGDPDFYLVTLQHQGQMTVSFQGVPQEIDIAFRVLSDTGDQIWGWQTAPSPGVPFEAWVDVKKPGRYAIEVRDGYNNAASSGRYAMAVTFQPTADPAEPNDQLVNATPLGWNQALSANILPIGDVDFYRVETDRQGQLTARFVKSPAALDMAFRVLNAQGDEVWGWQTAKTAGEVLEAWVDLKEPGPYVIEVRDGYNNARAPEPYEMVVSLDPTPDAAEPNDLVAHATPVSWGAPVSASILPQGDADFYRLEAERQGQLTARFVESPAALDMAFRVLNAQGDEVWGWQTAKTAGEILEAWVDLKEPGPYVIEVRDGYNNARAPEPYEMVVSLDPTPDVAEPNDRIEDAAPISWGTPVSASILPQGDADFYRISLTGPGKLTVAFTESPTDLNMAFRVLDDRGNQVVGWQSAKGNGEIFAGHAELPRSGSFVVEVRDGFNDARSVTAYGIVFTLE